MVNIRFWKRKHAKVRRNGIMVEGKNMVDFIKDNIELQQKYGHNRSPLDAKRLAFRMRLLEEEFNETMDAYHNGDPEEFVDGNIDIIVIAMGNLGLAGVDIEKAWIEVRRANMSKVCGENEKRPDSGGFDIAKPPGWQAPDHSGNHGVLPKIFENNNE